MLFLSPAPLSDRESSHDENHSQSPCSCSTINARLPDDASSWLPETMKFESTIHFSFTMTATSSVSTLSILGCFACCKQIMGVEPRKCNGTFCPRKKFPSFKGDCPSRHGGVNLQSLTFDVPAPEVDRTNQNSLSTTTLMVRVPRLASAASASSQYDHGTRWIDFSVC